MRRILRVYIASKWEEYRRIKRYADILRKRGIEITFPWFEHHVGPNIPWAVAAMDDVRGVREADTCIFIFDKDWPYRGAYSELGMAIALNKRIFVVGNNGDKNVFVHFPLVEKKATFDEVLECL